MVSPKQLVDHSKNRNKHPKDQIERLAKIINYQGWRYAIKVSKLSGQITSGHGRKQAALLKGWDKVPVVYQEYETKEQEFADVQADNAIALWAELDTAAISLDLKELAEFDISVLGIKDFSIDQSLLDPKCDEDEVPETDNHSFVNRGEIWQLGNHRLMCGDSTKIEDVELLMNGEKADMVFTDPPYGIGYEYESYKDISGDDYEDFCNKWFNILKEMVDFIVISTGWKYNRFWQNKEPSDNFYWICRNKMTGGSASHFRKCEPILIWGKPYKRYDFDFFEQTTQIEKELNGKHSCPKPVDLIKNILDGCVNGGNILDVFGGSGTTLIACEKTNRKCFMMEIDEHYCTVIIERWQKYTGKTAEKIK